MTGTPQERAMEEMFAQAATDPAMRPMFVRALMDSEVYVLGATHADVGALELLNLVDTQGPVLPMYTSLAALNRTLEALPDTDPACLRLRCRDLWLTAAGERFVLNPHGPHTKVFTVAEVAALLEGREPGLTEMRTDHPVVLNAAPLQVTPTRLVQVLRRFFDDRMVVAQAALAWAELDGQPPCYLLVVASDAPEDALSGLGSLGVESLTDGVHLDIVVEPVADAGSVLPGVAPFYRANVLL